MVKIVRLDKGSIGDSYLLSLNELAIRNLINPSLDRSVSTAGQETLERLLSPHSFNREFVDSTLQRLYVLQGVPDLSEMDAFVLNAAEILGEVPFEKRLKIQQYFQSLSMSEVCFYTLAAIKLLKDATEMCLIEVNPAGCPPDQCYVKYLIEKPFSPNNN